MKDSLNTLITLAKSMTAAKVGDFAATRFRALAKEAEVELANLTYSETFQISPQCPHGAPLGKCWDCRIEQLEAHAMSGPSYESDAERAAHAAALAQWQSTPALALGLADRVRYYRAQGLFTAAADLHEFLQRVAPCAVGDGQSPSERGEPVPTLADVRAAR